MPLKFIADVDLKQLTKRLRMLGMDCTYNGGASLPDLIQTAIKEKRILLTQKHIAATSGLNIHKLNVSDPVDQLRVVTETFNLNEEFTPFTRCLECNCLLKEADESDISSQIPDSVLERRLTVSFCPECKRCYWKGSHLERMIETLWESGIRVNKV